MEKTPYRVVIIRCVLDHHGSRALSLTSVAVSGKNGPPGPIASWPDEPESWCCSGGFWGAQQGEDFRGGEIESTPPMSLCRRMHLIDSAWGTPLCIIGIFCAECSSIVCTPYNLMHPIPAVDICLHVCCLHVRCVQPENSPIGHLGKIATSAGFRVRFVPVDHSVATGVVDEISAGAFWSSHESSCSLCQGWAMLLPWSTSAS